MKNQTKLIALSGVLLAILLGVGIAGMVTPKNGRVQGAITTPTPALTSLSYGGIDGQTALTILSSKATIQTKGTGPNAFVTSINGRAADDSKKEFWAFYVNDKQADVGAGSYTTKAGDRIRWQIETY